MQCYFKVSLFISFLLKNRKFEGKKLHGVWDFKAFHLFWARLLYSLPWSDILLFLTNQIGKSAVILRCFSWICHLVSDKKPVVTRSSREAWTLSSCLMIILSLWLLNTREKKPSGKHIGNCANISRRLKNCQSTYPRGVGKALSLSTSFWTIHRPLQSSVSLHAYWKGNSLGLPL